jgi:NAD(P)-dependent dehydrogenase (short-subunit alcohol dehydrogenase family)
MTPEHKPSILRRNIVGLASAGLVAAAVAAVGRAQGSAGRQVTGEPPMEDPHNKYPKPPYPSQTQPWPGLAGEMRPLPDHGETSYKGSDRLIGRKALGTGGDSGMGRAAAIAFSREGADVAINYFPAEEPDAREVVALIRADGRKAVAIPGDLRQGAFCKELVERAARELGGLDILVNNASRQQIHASLEDMSTEQFDWTTKTNIYATCWLTKALLKHLQPGAVIIQTTSEQATDPSANLVDYAMTKAAMLNFTRSMAKHLAPKGIRVNGVVPGPISAPLHALKGIRVNGVVPGPISAPLQVSGGATQDKLVKFAGETPLGRAGQPTELGGTYVRLAENDGSHATGQSYGSTGGNGQP